MSLSLLPPAFFGSGYVADSSAHTISFPTRDSIPSVTDTFTVSDTTLVMAAAWSVGMTMVPVKLSSTTTLPAPFEADTIYYLTCSATPATTMILQDAAGEQIDPEDAGTGTHSYRLYSGLLEVTDDEADEITGDWRKVLMGLLEYLIWCWNGGGISGNITPKPTKITVTNSSYRDTTTNEDVTTYTFKVRTRPLGREVSPE